MKRIVKRNSVPEITDPITGKKSMAPGYVEVGDGKYYDVADGIDVDPKDIIAEGDDRYNKLPAADKNKVLEAFIKDGAEPDPKKKQKRVKMNQVKAGDEVLEMNIRPHAWFGESSQLVPPI